MIFASWGKDSREIGYWGILKCSNCKNYGHFSINELTNKVKLYFITVAKYDKKRYLICPICNAGYEIKDSEYESTIRALPSRFNEEKTNLIWDFLDNGFSRSIENIIVDNDIDEKAYEIFINDLREQLIDKYGNADNINEITTRYIEFIFDEDRAR